VERRQSPRTPPWQYGKADTAKPFKGVDGGVFEIALHHRGDAFRVLYGSCRSARRFGSFTHSRRNRKPESRRHGWRLTQSMSFRAESSSRGAIGRRETPVFQTGFGDAAIQES
jgi:hypothetical protein